MMEEGVVVSFIFRGYSLVNRNSISMALSAPAGSFNSFVRQQTDVKERVQNCDLKIT
jgi:hypothetical protein